MEPWAGVDEEQLVARAKAGQAEAYGELVRRHQARVYGAVRRVVGEAHEAPDLAQEVFVRAYAAMGSFEDGRPFGPWIGRVAVNLALSWAQRRRLPTVSLTPDDAGDAPQPPPDYSAEPERVYLSGERRAAIGAAIAELPPHYRAVVELRHLQGCSYETIAETLGMPLSDVKSHLFRARQMLRRRLEDER
jgi:RNA polymerase sigma-70 factor (ECF subfamily)